MSTNDRLAVVTGASSGIGYELSRCCARHGYDLVIAADDSAIQAVVGELQALGAVVDTNVTGTLYLTHRIGREMRNFFERADLMDTKVGQEENKADPAEVAKIGFEAMVKGEAGVVAGAKNKLQVAAAHVIPDTVLAEQHRKKAEPGSGKRD